MSDDAVRTIRNLANTHAHGVPAAMGRTSTRILRVTRTTRTNHE